MPKTTKFQQNRKTRKQLEQELEEANKKLKSQEDMNKQMEQMMKEIEELKAKQEEMRKVTEAESKKSGKEKVASKVKSLRETIINGAKGFGHKAKKFAEGKNEKGLISKKYKVIEKYKELLENINASYEKKLEALQKAEKCWEILEQDAIKDKAKLIEERDSILNSDIYHEYIKSQIEIVEKIKQASQASSEKDLEKVMETVKDETREYDQIEEKKNKAKNINKDEIIEADKRIQEARNMLAEIRNEIARTKQQRDEKLDEMTLDRETEIMSLSGKQNIWQRTLGKIFNRLNGTKKFEEKIMSLDAKIDELSNEEVEKIKAEIEESIKQWDEKQKEAEKVKQERDAKKLKSQLKIKIKMKEIKDNIKKVNEERIKANQEKLAAKLDAAEKELEALTNGGATSQEEGVSPTGFDRD